MSVLAHPQSFNLHRVNILSAPSLEVLEPLPVLEQTQQTNAPAKIAKQVIRSSLKASTMDGVLAAIFSNITGGVLLINFLLELGATPIEIGLLSSIPLLVNFLQPLGAFFADRMTSRRWCVLAIFVPSRLLWLTLLPGILFLGWSNSNPHQLVNWTLAIILIANILGALGSSAWFSWMAALVPERLRGRYFGIRNSAASLTNLISVPLLGFAISSWQGGKVQGYGVMLLFGIIMGLVSLVCQLWMKDINPQIARVDNLSQGQEVCDQAEKPNALKDSNFLNLLLYLGLWTFAINLSGPFFNLYLMQDLALDLTTVTFYSIFISGANMIMLVFWGKLSDRVGNRPVLLLVGVLIAVSPLFWILAGNDSLSLWVSLPLIHLMIGGSGAAIDLCSNNIKMAVAPANRPSQYFAIAAAVAGVSGGLGSTVGGFIASSNLVGGLPGLFALSAVLRLIALLPLIFVKEPRSQSVIEVLRNIFHIKSQPLVLSRVKIAVEVD